MEIPKFISDKLNQNKAYPHKFPIEYKIFLLEYSTYYQWGIENISDIFKLLKIHKGFLPKCCFKDCDAVVKITNEITLSKGCCWEHSYKCTNLEKYGSEHNFNNTHPSRKNQIKSFKEKYGVDNPMQVEIFKENLKKTINDKYGVDNPMQDKKIRAKQSVIQKETMVEKYGVEYALQNATLQSKHTQSCYYKKEYVWKTGEVSIVMGCEPIVLSELELQGYTYDDIMIENDLKPIIWYEYEGKQHRYFPDFFIPKENLIIEVKSEWTLEKQKKKNEAKFKAVKEAGFNFRLEIR